jgi:hypothetical protein
MTLSQRVAYRLTQIEIREPDAWFRDDLRIARLTVFFASNGNPDPWRYAFWWYLGKTPDKLIPFFVAREATRGAMEAGERGGDRASLLRPKDTPPTQPLPAKKPAHSASAKKAAA